MAGRAEAPAPHIVLVGLPGSGKTTIGRAVASRLGRPFLDFDEEIERREGRSVAEIFAGPGGEAGFRSLERELTREVAGQRGMVLAPGGGWIVNPEVVALLRPPARVIYLKVGPAEALRRMGAGRRLRPLLAGQDPASKLDDLLLRRETLYETADLVIDTELLGVEDVVGIICR